MELHTDKWICSVVENTQLKLYTYQKNNSKLSLRLFSITDVVLIIWVIHQVYLYFKQKGKKLFTKL